jgi:hypothetical protein
MICHGQFKFSLHTYGTNLIITLIIKLFVNKVKECILLGQTKYLHNDVLQWYAMINSNLVCTPMEQVLLLHHQSNYLLIK